MPQLPERRVILGTVFGRGAEDDVVHDVNFQKLTGANQVAGHFDVSLGWLWFSTGMIVHEHDGGR